METLKMRDQFIDVFLKKILEADPAKKMAVFGTPVDFAKIAVAPPTILIIDDDIAICEELEDLLRNYGYKVLCANSVKETKKILKEKNIDIVLLDLKLPDGNGLDLIGKIKDLRKDAYIIVITAYGSLNSAIKAIKEKVFDYITKPFDPEKLVEIVNQAALAQIKERKKRSDIAIKEQFQKLAVGRELKMIKLKKEIEQLKKECMKKEEELKETQKSR